MNDIELLKCAFEAREKSYSPYSGFKVGAALLCTNGKVYTGCNIENSAFSPTCCAERTAVFKAVSEGEREFSKIAVTGGKSDGQALQPCFPCGVCRQVMREFCDDDFEIIMSDGEGKTISMKLSGLLPSGFGLDINE